MGSGYATGHGGLPLNMATAVAWFRKAALQGDAEAQGTMAGFYTMGMGVGKDMKLAEEWTKKAAAQGHEGAQRELRKWAGQPPNTFPGSSESVLRTLTSAAEQGDQAMQRLLATLHRSGECGAERDAHRAKQLLKAGAAQGDSDAAGLLAGMRACASCGAPRPRFMCQRCREVKYCGQECQRKHWSEGPEPHKTHCTRKRVPPAALAV